MYMMLWFIAPHYNSILLYHYIVYRSIKIMVLQLHLQHITSLPAHESWGHYNDIIMSVMASQITGISIVYSAVCSGIDQRKLQSSASLAFVRGIHWWPVNSPHKVPVMREMIPFDDVIMYWVSLVISGFDYILPSQLQHCIWSSGQISI